MIVQTETDTQPSVSISSAFLIPSPMNEKYYGEKTFG